MNEDPPENSGEPASGDGAAPPAGGKRKIQRRIPKGKITVQIYNEKEEAIPLTVFDFTSPLFQCLSPESFSKNELVTVHIKTLNHSLKCSAVVLECHKIAISGRIIKDSSTPFQLTVRVRIENPEEKVLLDNIYQEAFR